MSKATLAKEVVVTCPNKVGILARATTTLAEGRVNIDACCCYAQDNETCNFHLVTSDPQKTIDLCRKIGWSCKENPIVCCELAHKVGTLADAAGKLSNAGIDIEYCYCSTGTAPTTKVFFFTKDNSKAVKTLGG